MTGALEADILVRRPDGFVLDLSLVIEPGETVALLGPNGAGKSTTVAVLCGAIRLDEGRIMLGERVLDDPSVGVFLPPEERGIGVVFQDRLLFPHMTVEENIGFASSDPRPWLERFELTELAKRRPAQLSGGEAQRVVLARALAGEPDVLLLDEPTAALDATARGEMRRWLLAHLSEFGGPRLIITHDPTEAFVLADSVCVIEGGSVTQLGTADELRMRPKTPYVADLVGVNLLVATVADGHAVVSGHTLQVPDSTATGEALLVIHPRAIALHISQPDGAARNVWRTTVRSVELLGDRARLQVGDPLALTVEITRRSAEALELAAGSNVWVSIKATEIHLDPPT